MSNYDLLILALYNVIELHFTSVHRTWPISAAILTSGLVNNAYLFCSR